MKLWQRGGKETMKAVSCCETGKGNRECNYGSVGLPG